MPSSDRDRTLGLSRPASSPIYTSSVYSLPDLDALERISAGEDIGFTYARDGHPNAADLASQLAKLEAATWGVIAGSGMGAITATLLAMLKSGNRVVASDQLYGRTAQWLGQEISRFGVATSWINIADLDAVKAALSTPAQALLVETISNPLLRVSDIPRLAELAHPHGAKLIVDNTFATPTLCQPLNIGADVVIESLTKLIGGHSDITLGAAFGNDAQLGATIARIASVWGMPASPFDCWLATRSLPTLALRAHAAASNALLLATWLGQQAGINRVVYPGLGNHPDYELANRLISGPPGNMVAFELTGGRDAVNTFMRRGSTIPFSPSLGGTATTCSYPAGTSHRFVDKAEKQRLGITDGLIRLSVGIEPFEEIVVAMAEKLGLLK
jgi:cystathionine beta-lyase/cystathionine gamma-synthase